MADDQSADQFKGQPRLPTFAVPRCYDLFLRPDLSACTFSGYAAITVEVVSPTRFLVLNAADLNVNHASIHFQELVPSEIVSYEEDQILVIGFSGALPLDQGVLRMEFTGTLNDDMRGFYISKYEYNGETKNMAVTQFQAVDARRCFPCWDEPAFKAKFKLRLQVSSELVALSNMPVAEETVDGVVKTLTFMESPLMSTYLVAIVIGLLDYIEDLTSDGIKVRVYCQNGRRDQVKFALEVGVKCLDWYKDYFATPYALPKMDMVAIPDFAAGAMENYGLVTYKETNLLYDESSSTVSNKQKVAITVAHELAHQWFGNLVTMEWWTHLWLNEGFATWMSYLAVDVLYPEWNMWPQFLGLTASGLRLDSLNESHPIEVEVNFPDEIDAIFDDISYDKGSSVLRMLQSYLGAETFQKALASYIKKYAYSNATTGDLWAVLEEESGEPVKDLMNKWTKQQGYPVLYAKFKEPKLELAQAQFLLDGSSGSGRWIVPFTICGGSHANQRKLLLEDKFLELDIYEPSWIKLNIDQTGFFRVWYDAELAARLVNAVQDKKLSVMDRIGIVEDSYALSMACKQTLKSLLILLHAYHEESDYNVLSRVISVSVNVANIVADATPQLSSGIKEILIRLLLEPAQKLGWDPKDGEDYQDVMLRSELLTALVKLGHGETIKEGVKRFHIFLDDRSTPLLPADLRKAAYLAVMQTVHSTNKSGYDALLKIYRETTEAEEKMRVLGSLAFCRDASIVLDALNFVFTDEVRNQDAPYVLQGISREGRETAWDWMQENWDVISKTWVSSLLISKFVDYIVSPFTSDEKADEIEEFFSTRVKPTFERALKQSVEWVRINARWARSIKSEESLAKTVHDLLNKGA